jgi:acyl-homoserine-lactone acylase
VIGRGVGLVGLLVAACGPTDEVPPGAPDPYDVSPGPYTATVRYTEHGVPHVAAPDVGSAAYGLGYAFATDRGCVLMDQVIKVRGERARWYGRGPDDVILDEDFGWRALAPLVQAESAWFHISDEARAMVLGYTTGFNDAIAASGWPTACDGAPWVRPLTHIDVLANALGFGLDGSGAVFVGDIGRATPPSALPSAEAAPGWERIDGLRERLTHPGMGSNGWAIGRDRSTGGAGMLLSNTHFPAVGEKQWYEAHLTVPGVMNVYGAMLVGVPLVNLGFNEHVAWTHTVSYAPRFVAYALEVDPARPTRYRYGDGWRDMEGTAHEVEVLEPDGTVSTASRTTWRSHYGPVIDAPLVGWTQTLAFTFRDVNALDLGLFDVWYGMDVATNLDELRQSHVDTQGDPWVYTLAADAAGEVWFGDTSRVPYLSDEALAGWETLKAGSTVVSILASQFASFGAILLDGSDPVNEWVVDPRSGEPGLVPLELAPQVTRTDYVFNANDSHWLTNAAEPLAGYAEALFGPERTPRSARTRMNARLLDEVGAGAASGEDGKFSLDEVEAAALSMRSSITEVALADVVARCADVVAIDLGDGPVDLTAACADLAAWDGRYTTGARGAVVWRLLLGEGFEAYELNAGGGGLFVTPFDADDPLGTPRDVVPATEDPADDPVLRALALAVGRLAALPPGATLGEVQRQPQDDGSTVGVPGGQYWEGTIGIAEWSDFASTTLLARARRGEVLDETTGLTADGWWVNDGNSFILAMTWQDGAPVARAVMTYSQSDDPTSPYVADQAAVYTSRSLRPVRFTEADIAAATVRTLELTR